MIIEKSEEIIRSIGKVLIGKEEVVKKVLMAIYAKGNVLLEDTPGVGKTTLALAFAKARPVHAGHNAVGHNGLHRVQQADGRIRL